MTNIDAQLVAWGIDPKYMSENEKIGKIYDKGFQFALDKVLEIIDQMDKENEKCNGEISRLLLRIEHKDFRERVLALKGGEQEC